MPLGIRITKSQLHRAFAELDRFTDEKCLKFVKAAQGGFLLRSGMGLLLLALFLLLTGGLVFGAASLYLALGGTFEERLLSGRGRIALNVGILGGTAAILLGASLASLFARDLWLRGRIRYVLDMRGRCSKCHYGLLGLPVSEKFEVRCPECGETTKVDPSLAALASESASGERRLVSEDAVLDTSDVFWTTQRRRFVARWVKRSALGAAGLVVLLIMAALCWEVFIRVQASRAVKMRPGVAAIQKFVESKQPVAYSAEEDAWAVLVKAIETMNLADREFKGGEMKWPTFTKAIKTTSSQTDVWDGSKGRMIEPGEDVVVEQTRELYPEFTFILNPPKHADAFEDAYNRAIAELGRTMIGKYEEAGVFDLLRQLPTRRWAVKPLQLNGDETAYDILLPELGAAREFARIETGRIDLALAEGDVDRAIDAFEEIMAIQRVLGQQGWMISRLTSHAIYFLGATRFGQVAAKADAAQLTRLESILNEQVMTLTAADAIESERLGGVDVICWAFSDTRRVRFGKYSSGLRDLIPGSGGSWGRGRHLGFLGQNVDALSAYYEQAKKNAGLPRSQQSRQPAILPASLGLVRGVAAWTNSIYDSEHLRAQHAAAMQMMLAAYRFRAAKGNFPKSRTELEAFVGNAFPIDAMTEMPLELLRLDPAKDKFGRGFVVYSVGPDGVDNGGVEGPRNVDGYLPGFKQTPSGSDFIFFDPAGR